MKERKLETKQEKGMKFECYESDTDWVVVE
jgi:hypothetical protein